MKFRTAAKGRRLLFLVAVCLLPALLVSPTAEASRSLPAGSVSLEPPAPRRDAEAPPAPRLGLFHLEDEVLLEILTGVEPEDHEELLAHRRLELLPPSTADAAIQKTASGVSTSDLGLNLKERNAVKPDLRWTVPFYAKARFYDPEVGRFLTEDPAEPDLTTPPSLHRYLYAYGNPTYYTDPDGRETIDVTSDGEVYWVVEKDLAGPINPNTRRVLVGHVAMKKGLFRNKPSGEVQLLDEFGGGSRPLDVIRKASGRFRGRDGTGSVVNPSDISGLSLSLQNTIISNFIDGELNPRRELRMGSTSMPTEGQIQFEMGREAWNQQVQTLRRQFYEREGYWPGADDPIWIASDLTDVTYGDGSTGIYEGIEPDYTVETLIVSIAVPATLEFRAGLAAGRTTMQAAGRAGFTALDEGFAEATGLPVSPTGLVRGGGAFRDASGRLRNADGKFAFDGGRSRQRTTAGTHGNTAGDQPATLYERYDADDTFLKHGVSQDPSRRYIQSDLDGGYLIETQYGPRWQILRTERKLVETNPGPLNREPWAGKRKK